MYDIVMSQKTHTNKEVIPFRLVGVGHIFRIYIFRFLFTLYSFLLFLFSRTDFHFCSLLSSFDVPSNLSGLRLQKLSKNRKKNNNKSL